MIFFLLLYFFPLIHGDCLEFPNHELINECLIKQSTTHSLAIERYYPQCLQCRIQTVITAKEIQFEETNQCLTIELQCIQLIFNNQSIFEEFFHSHQQYIYDLFNQDNGTAQNTLHVILKENTLDEIDLEYIERIFPMEYQAYRALFLEFDIHDSKIEIHGNLVNLTRLAMKIILNCGSDIKPMQTIYTILNQKISLESKQDFCALMFMSSSTAVPSTLFISTLPDEVFLISNEKSKDIALIIILFTGFLLCAFIVSLIYCFKWIRRYYSRSLKKDATTSEMTISEDISMETPLSLKDKPKLSLKVKRPLRGIRAIQLLNDDI